MYCPCGSVSCGAQAVRACGPHGVMVHNAADDEIDGGDKGLTGNDTLGVVYHHVSRMTKCEARGIKLGLPF